MVCGYRAQKPTFLLPMDACICHNPLSNLRLGSGIAPVRMLMDSGVTLGSERMLRIHVMAQSMFEAMRLAATLSRAQASDSKNGYPPVMAFAMATDRQRADYGAQECRHDRGRMGRGHAVPGRWLLPLYAAAYPLDQIVFAENGAALREVMIAGEYVFANDRVLTLDEAALAKRAADAATRLDEANADTRTLNAAASAVVQSFLPRDLRAPLPDLRRKLTK